MKLIFVDEIAQPHKKPGFFGVATLVVNSRFYQIFKTAFDEALEQAKWSRGEEFKGRYILSSSKGDKTVAVETRVELVRAIVAPDDRTEKRTGAFLLRLQRTEKDRR